MTIHDDLIVGMLLSGPYNDQGWNQAHYEALQFLHDELGYEVIYMDKVNLADMPETTAYQAAATLYDQGALVIIFTTADMTEDAVSFAGDHPDSHVILADSNAADPFGLNYVQAANLNTAVGQMEYGQMIAGCAAALQTNTGDIGYLGALINNATRRLAASAYLGARYCYENYRGEDPNSLDFKVDWIGFWFYIPGITSDPAQITRQFFDSGYDVVISGIDTLEALTVAEEYQDMRVPVWAVPFNNPEACANENLACLGVPYYNWRPVYEFLLWNIDYNLDWFEYAGYYPPDWSNINDLKKSPIGFIFGAGLSDEYNLRDFISVLASGEYFWNGSIHLQDGSQLVPPGGKADYFIEVYYLPQLLQGMEGQSNP